MPPIFNEDLAYEWLFDDLDWNRIFNSQIYLNPFIPRTDQISFSVLFFYPVYWLVKFYLFLGVAKLELFSNWMLPCLVLFLNKPGLAVCYFSFK